MDRKQWLKGIDYEVAYWNNVFRWKSTFMGVMNWSHYGREIELEGFAANEYLLSVDNPKVLDVGSGLSYAPGNHLSVDGKLIPLDIQYVDPLAFHFNKILARYHHDLPPITFGMVEYLSSFYPPHGDIDLIVIQNALDHSSDPVKGVLEAFSSLKTGGILYLNHHPNEAEAESYRGFHQYNICFEDGHIIIWNRSGRTDVNELLSAYAEVETKVHENGHVIAIIRKTSDMPMERTRKYEDIVALCKQMIYSDSNLASHPSYWFYNTVQFISQPLPVEWKNWLKSVYGKLRRGSMRLSVMSPVKRHGFLKS